MLNILELEESQKYFQKKFLVHAFVISDYKEIL
jgi:hypothetical protein